jgi:hypothetical protein
MLMQLVPNPMSQAACKGSFSYGNQAAGDDYTACKEHVIGENQTAGEDPTADEVYKSSKAHAGKGQGS